MSKIDDTQKDVSVTSGGTFQQIHTPTGLTPAHGADNPIVSPKVVPFSAGKQITPTTIVTPFQRLANPA